MRKREIHSVAHWCMMFILLMFPILMVGISGFGHSQYSEQHVQKIEQINNAQSYADTFTYNVKPLDTSHGTSGKQYYSYISIDNVNSNAVSFSIYSNQTNAHLIMFWDANNVEVQRFTWGATQNNDFDEFYFTKDSGENLFNFANVYLVTYTETQLDYRYDINEWCDQFIDLPINSWYKSLMNVIGVGFTNSSVMNVIYVMPVYILWVFIFDVIVDCFLVIIKLPHKLLNRLSGGENE